ncbi:hypothetical protein [Kaistella palustris]|uniref:hypothetical protein n=1 Tax=Kaistella palustris TaxID=493376 RepID=UPI00041107C6|nr:hypothetical protein [Kaistella palustris]
MNFSQFLFEFLKKEGHATLPGFGVFSLKTAHAFLDKDGKNILPPGLEIAFDNNAEVENQTFVNFLAKEKGMPFNDAQAEIKKQVDFWNLTLEKEGTLTVENFGTFSIDDSKVHFKQTRTGPVSPDFYGLEEINISEIKKPAAIKDRNKPRAYRFSKSLVWVLPLLAAIAALAYFGLTQPEMLFGKRSFAEDIKSTPVSQPAVQPLKKDTLQNQNPVLDSTGTDSLTTAAAAVSAKKWSSKKYPKSKWQNQKKRRNP